MMASSDKIENSAVDEVAETKPAEVPVTKPPGVYDKIWCFAKSKFDSFNIGHLLLILFGLHLFAMSFPSDGGDYVFDEAYYVPAAKDLLNLVPGNLEHPFFGKLWGSLGIYLFGNDFFGWRIFYVVIGVLTVWAFYELALNFFSKEKALFAASMLGFETLFFIHTSLDLLEGPPIFFALLGFLAYFKKRYYWAAASFRSVNSQQGVGRVLCHSALPVSRVGYQERTSNKVAVRAELEEAPYVCTDRVSGCFNTAGGLRCGIPPVHADTGNR